MTLPNHAEYRIWLTKIKQAIRSSQIKAALKVNSELIQFYWHLGSEIVSRQTESNWGDRLISQLSHDLLAEFPDMGGFSERNLKYVRQWYIFYKNQLVDQNDRFGQQVVAQLTGIPWGQNIAIITKCKTLPQALYYVQQTQIHGWTRVVLTHQIENGLWEREGKAISNFSNTLPAPQSELAKQALKDPYLIDFLSLSKEHTERELETGLIEHITQFLLELGAGFAYIGRQVQLQVGKRSFFIDLLFYHARLHCYIVVELKTVEFEPEHAGKLNFYIKTVDEQLRKNGDHPTIGILICKDKDQMVVEYALSDIRKPIGVSEYRLTKSLPDDLKSSLPTIEEIEAELGEKTPPENT